MSAASPGWLQVLCASCFCSKSPDGLRRARGAAWLAAVLVLASGAVFRIQKIGELSYWFDESFTWKTISFPWSEMPDRVARDNQPPLYYLLLKLWASVWGSSPTALRSFSVLCGLLTVACIFLFVRAAYCDVGQTTADAKCATGRQPKEPGARGLRTAWLAAALVSLSPFQIQWALQARMYTLLTALVALSSWLMVRAVRTSAECSATGGVEAGVIGPENRRSPVFAWAIYTLSATAVVYTHYYGLFAVASQFLFLFGLASLRAILGDRHAPMCPKLPHVLASAACVWLAFSLWAEVFLRQLGQVRAAFWIQPADWHVVATTFYQMFAHWQYHGGSNDVQMSVAELCVALLVLLVTWRAAPLDWYVAISAALPFAAAVALSSFEVRVFDTHYFVAAHLFFLVALSSIVGRINAPVWRRLLCAALVAGSLLLCAMHWGVRDRLSVRPGAQGAVAWLDGARKPGEPVIVCSPMIATTIAAHAKSVGPIYVLRAEQDAYPHYLGTAVFDEDDYADSDDLATLSGEWAWAVDTDKWDNGTLKVPMPDGWTLRAEERFKEIYGNEYELVLRLYQRERQRLGQRR